MDSTRSIECNFAVSFHGNLPEPKTKKGGNIDITSREISLIFIECCKCLFTTYIKPKEWQNYRSFNRFAAILHNYFCGS